MSNPAGNPADPNVVSEISSKATTALVTGILGILCCALLGIWAVIAGNQAEQMIAQHGVGQEHKTKATIGKVLGIIALVLWVLAIIANVVLNLGG